MKELIFPRPSCTICHNVLIIFQMRQTAVACVLYLDDSHSSRRQEEGVHPAVQRLAGVGASAPVLAWADPGQGAVG